MVTNAGEVTGLFGNDHIILLHIWEKWRKPRSMKGWGSSDPIDSWHGVVTNSSSGRVIELDLSRCFISGRIPDQLGNLTELTILRLNANNLEGGIPQRLANLTKLTGLYLNSNKLSGTIPEQLGNLSKLTEMHLHNNKLAGSIPGQLGNLTKLKKLYLSKNKLEGRLPEQLGNLYELTELYLGENMMEGFIPEQLGSLDKLTKLVLCGNKFEGAIPEQVGKLPQLTTLRLDDNNNKPSAAGSSPERLGTPSQVTRQEEVDAAAGNVSSSVEGDDRTILLHCCEAWGKPSSLINWERWGSNDPIDTWPGVSTDKLSSRRVVRLELKLSYLSGTIPEQLGNLTQLKALDLSCNKLSGTIPEQLGNLTQLKKLILFSNKLSGVIPKQLANLTQLTALDLRNNELSGTIPEQLGNLTQLKKLILFSNKLSGTIPKQLGNLTQLTLLNLSSNELSGTIPEQLGNLTQLTTLLYLSYNELSGTIPEQLGNLTQLAALALKNNKLSGVIPEQLGNLTQLTLLDLKNNKLSGTIPKQLGNLTQLKQLDLSSNKLSGVIPKQLANLTQLTALDLKNNKLSGVVPEQLGNRRFKRNLLDIDATDEEHSGGVMMNLALDPRNGNNALSVVSPTPQLAKGAFSVLKLFIAVGLHYLDVVSDILTAVQYFNDGHEGWFAISISLVAISWLVSIVTLTRDTVEEPLKAGCFGCFHLHPLYLVQLSYQAGVEDQLLLLTKFDEAVCESAPQLLLQAYVIMVLWGEEVPLLLKVSLAVSFATLCYNSTVALDREDVNDLMAALEAAAVPPEEVTLPAEYDLEEANINQVGVVGAGEGGDVALGDVKLGARQQQPRQTGFNQEEVQPPQKTSSNGGQSTDLVGIDLEVASSLCMLPFFLTRALSVMSRGLALVLLGTALRSYALLALPMMLVARGRLLFLFNTDQEWSRILKVAAFSIIMDGIMPGELYGKTTLLVAVESAVFCTVALTSPSIVVSPRPFPAWVAEYTAVAVALTFVLSCLLDAAFLPAAMSREDDEAFRFTVVAQRWAAFCRDTARRLAPLFQALGRCWEGIMSPCGAVLRAMATRRAE